MLPRTGRLVGQGSRWRGAADAAPGPRLLPRCGAAAVAPSSSSSRARRLSSMPTMTIFDRAGKKRQRARAALAPDWKEYDYLRSEVARRLVDRLEDIMREFPQAMELGAYGPHILQEVDAVQSLSGKGGAGGIEHLVRCGIAQPGLLLPATRGPGQVAMEDLVADEEHLPFPAGTFDLVVSNLSLHWVNDLPATMAQACHALKPDGVFLASMLGGNTLKELRVALQLAEQEREGGISPHISPAAHVADCGSLLQAAGFALPTVDVDTVTVMYPDALVLMEHLQGMGESSAILTRRAHVSRDTFLAAAAIYQELFGEEDGSVPATFQVVYMIGWSPHESQQKPLQRGSGQVSLKTLGREGEDGSSCSR